MSILTTSALRNTEIELCRATAPVPAEQAWEIESLLLRIFEYGDYSFRAALSGEYSGTLNCTFFLARHKSRLVAAAGCLCGLKNPAVSIIGPVGVARQYRRKGIGIRLVASLLRHLKRTDCAAVYLGAPDGVPARSLYESLGFKPFEGIVMRNILCERGRCEENYFSNRSDTAIRGIEWGDLPGTQALACSPCTMYTFDYLRGVFSSRYVKPVRFLSIFPEMMKAHERDGGLANVLTTGPGENVVGLAHFCRGAGEAQHHIAQLDFYVHDNFLERADLLVRRTIEQSGKSSVRRLYCRCLECDEIKRSIVEALGGKRIALLRENVLLPDRCANVLVYEL
jgi:GNAT superfamily N-acetyltransferase